MLPPDKENQRNRQFEGKRVVDARKAGPGGEVREERNNQRNTEVNIFSRHLKSIFFYNTEVN